jgi:hypothetical protein
METKVLVFSADLFDRSELEMMSDKEKYEYASVASTIANDEADVLSLKAFETMSNNEEIFLDNSWIYFVTI